MVVISEIMRYYKIDNNLINDSNYWNKIVKDLHQTLSQQSNLENKIMVISLQNITTDDTNMIPKLEYKTFETFDS